MITSLLYENVVQIPVGDINLTGNLSIPEKSIGIVIFSHGSGSSRLSTRNRYVASQLNKSSIATLLFDLLTEEEDQFYENRFDIELLSSRLIAVTQWVLQHEKTAHLPIGYFGSSTGAASALNAATQFKDKIKTVVSRGGRPDMSGPNLSSVSAPTLLIIGGQDSQVIDLNRLAYSRLHCSKEMRIIPGATHLFEEPGKLKEAAQISTEWFVKYLS